jgi:hypothetical protein
MDSSKKPSNGNQFKVEKLRGINHLNPSINPQLMKENKAENSQILPIFNFIRSKISTARAEIINRIKGIKMIILFY